MAVMLIDKNKTSYSSVCYKMGSGHQLSYTISMIFTQQLASTGRLEPKCGDLLKISYTWTQPIAAKYDSKGLVNFPKRTHSSLTSVWIWQHDFLMVKIKRHALLPFHSAVSTYSLALTGTSEEIRELLTATVINIVYPYSLDQMLPRQQVI